VIHDGMQYDLMQGKGHEPFTVGNPSIFKSYLLRYLQWVLYSNRPRILKLGHNI